MADLTDGGRGKPRPPARPGLLRGDPVAPQRFPKDQSGAGGWPGGGGEGEARGVPGRGPGLRRSVSMAARREGLEGVGRAARGHPSQTLEEGVWPCRREDAS